MKSTGEILAILGTALPELKRGFPIRRIALFGSYARGEQTESSDVDVLVDVDPAIGLRFVDLADRIEALLGVRADVVSLRAIPERHLSEIQEELLDVA
ncbi:MAG: nucleotidyltransferase family protein [Candidatus Eisenbacteria bacterium]